MRSRIRFASRWLTPPRRPAGPTAPVAPPRAPVPIDVEGPLWQGFHRGWEDGDAGRAPARPRDRGPLWSAGYDAGWAAARPGPVGAGHGDPAWN